MKIAELKKTSHKNELVQTRVPLSIKQLAVERAEHLGLSLSTIMSIFMTKFAFEGGLPAIHPIEVPNAETLTAIEEADKATKGYRTPKALFKHLGI